MNKKRVFVGMSGGVDSSVAALILKKSGYQVTALFMKNWEEKNEQGICTSLQDLEDVQKVCERLQIPYYVVNFAQKYWDLVFSKALTEFEKGLTPNPDILCNKEIKFKALLEKAIELGGDFLATGHYARIFSKEGHFRLLKGIDPEKDQSYFLCSLKEETLKKILFPLGDLTKKDVRKIALENHLPTAEKRESMGICFIGKRNFKQFLHQFLPYQPGDIETKTGKIVGHHDGLAFYTIGQRKGLKIGGKGEAWYIVEKNFKRNVLVVEQGENHSALFIQEVRVGELSWIGKEAPSQLPFPCFAKIRYRQSDQQCQLTQLKGQEGVVRFFSPQRAVTPSQALVLYDHEICLGGGKILP